MSSSLPQFAGFRLTRRGYDRNQVDRYLTALADGGSVGPATFDIRWRGYDREEVDARIRELRGR